MDAKVSRGIGISWTDQEGKKYKEVSVVGRIVFQKIYYKIQVLNAGHVLLMEFVGKDGWPAPLLKNAVINAEVRGGGIGEYWG